MDLASSSQRHSFLSGGETSAPARRRSVFLDRDGTIIHDGHYLSEPAEVKLLPDARAALQLLRDAGFALFLFTNQSGVGRGLFPLEAVHRCNLRMLQLLGLGANLFTDICIAPERPDEPMVYRKPSPRFIVESIARHGLDPHHAWMVGDKAIDVAAGLNAKINAALIGRSEDPACKNVPQFATLLGFAETVANAAK